MAVVTFEGTISGGKLCLPEGTRLPENGKFYLVVPGLDEAPKDNEPIAATLETKKISKEEWAARGAEIDAAYADYPDEEEAATIRLMRSKAAKVAKREVW